ncbi:MAG: hypothetical protein ACR2LZ_03870 [Pyrinomonadaceae bacterium]
MMDQLIKKEIFTRLDMLPVEKQQQVLNFIRVIASPTGVAGKELLRFAGTIEPDDLHLITQAVENGCEQVDADEW